ncbi:hypothetical protein SVAN01_04517 [Stagonosporopsis vannaccii]|nr:hypothetical protein SVAN01_04517 [Stagonosporopsis vannaccii]
MAKEWARDEREGWLCHLYGKDDEEGARNLPPDSVQHRLVDGLEGLLSHDVSPEDAAMQTASLIMSQEEISTPWANHIGLHLKATESFDDEKILQALADYLVELASLPDAIHKGPQAKTIELDSGFEQVELDRPIEIDGHTLWRDLPGYSMNLTESLQGPEQYLEVHGGHKKPLEAMQAWKNINTYIALVAVHPKAQAVPVLANHARLGVRTLAVALEHSNGTRLGRNAELHAPAAAQWLRIASKEIERVCAEGTQRFMTGDLWQSRGGTEVCDSARLAFWKSRLEDVGY